eukprot:jgi/Undpi1/13187/HiC_scaffold_8.g02849.m1
MKTAAAEEGRANDQAVRHAILLEANCEDLEVKKDRLLCRVHTLELREREATAKSAFDAAEKLEREAHDASGKAEIDANQLREEMDKCQALGGERDQRVGDVHNLGAVQREESAKAASDAAQAQQHAARQAQERDANNQQIQARVIARIDDLERHARGNRS